MYLWCPSFAGRLTVDLGLSPYLTRSLLGPNNTDRTTHLTVRAQEAISLADCKICTNVHGSKSSWDRLHATFSLVKLPLEIKIKPNIA